MQVGTDILNSIKNGIAEAGKLNVGHYAGRAVVLIQANPIPVVIAIVAIAAVIFIAYKYFSQPAEANLEVVIEFDVVDNDADENMAGANPDDKIVVKSEKVAVLTKAVPYTIKKNSKKNHVNQVAVKSLSTEPKVELSEPVVITQKSDNIRKRAASCSKSVSKKEPKTIGSKSQLPASTKGSSQIKIDAKTLENFKNSLLNENMTPDAFNKSLISLGVDGDSILNESIDHAANHISDPSNFFSLEFQNRVTSQLKNIHKVTNFLKDNGCRAGTAGVTFLTGLANVFCGNPYGLVSLAISIKEFYNMQNNGLPEGLEEVFNDIQGNFEVIDKLSEQSKNALFGIKEHIEKTKDKLTDIETVFENIKLIIKEDSVYLLQYEKEIEELKNSANNYNPAAEFKTSLEHAERADVLFQKCLDDINQFILIKDLKDTDATQKIEQFIGLAGGLAEKFKNGMEYFRASQLRLNLGINSLIELEKIYFKLNCEEENLIKLSKAINEKITEWTKENSLKEANEHLDHANAQIEEALRIKLEEDETIQELKGNIVKVKDEVNAWVDQNMILGALGAAIGAPFGPVTAGTLAIACPKAVNAAMAFFTPKSDLKTDFEDPKIAGDISYGFYTESTGCFYMFKGASTTAGEVKIHAANAIKTYAFNLNQPNCGLDLALVLDLPHLSEAERAKAMDALNQLLQLKV